MLLILLFAAVNAALSFFGQRVFRLPGFDVTPFAIIVIAWSGESILLGTLLLTVSYSFHSVGRLRYLWLTVPATLIVGYLALVVPSMLLLLIAYHLLCAVSAFALSFFGARYFIFVLTNFSLNLVAMRLYAFIKL